MSAAWRRFETAPRSMPLVGALIGAVGGIVYWLAAQLWPTSIAVVLSMLATTWISRSRARDAADTRDPARARNAADWDIGIVGSMFALLIEYNALMALSAANLALALPPNLALGVIMIAGHAASRALVVSVLASPTSLEWKPATHADLGIALAVGFAPAALMGMPGLIGLAAAIAARIGLLAHLRRYHPPIGTAALAMTQQLTELCFYLGALAARAYV